MLGRCLVDWPSRYKAIDWLLQFSKGYLVLQALVFPEVVKNKFSFSQEGERTHNRVTGKYGGQLPQAYLL